MLEKQGSESTDATTGPAAANAATSAGKSTLTGTLQRHGAGNGGGGGGSNQEIAASGFSGPSHEVPYRSEMESGFGVSFGGVQAYSGGAAAEASSSLGAEAYAVGQQVAFKDTAPSRDMVAHELAHTIQQGDAGPVQTWSEGSSGDAFETEADNAAASVLAGETPTVGLRTGGTIHKWGGSDHYTIGNLAGQKALQRAQAAQIRDIAQPEAPPDPGVAAPGAPGTAAAPGAPGAPATGLGDRPDAFNVPSSTGGVAHGATPDANGHTAPTLAGTADAHQRERQQAGGIGGDSTGVVTGGGSNATLGVHTANGTISFGAASRFSGDYANTVNGSGGLNSRDSELSGAGSGERTGDQGPNLIQFAQMTIGGMTNSNHFFPLNGNEYRGHHGIAVEKAGAANAKARANDLPAARLLMEEALREEGFASHFLQDTFSAGHMVPRALDSIEDMHGDRHTMATALHNAATGATATVAGGASTAGSAVGNVTGAVSGFFSRVTSLQNPFSAEGRAAIGARMDAQAAETAQSFGTTATAAMNFVTSPLQQGGAVNAAVERADRTAAFYDNALQGLTRSKQWHDYFCALPNGLPTTQGRFHGDYMMDGHDLEYVSDTAANSIAEVVAAGHGKAVQGGRHEPAAPAYSEIMADPMAGPVWRLMMQDYRASLEAARRELQPGDTGHTDGGTAFTSADVMAQIEAVSFGGTGGVVPTAAEERAAVVATAGHDPSSALTTSHTALNGVIQNLEHYLSTEFGYNANLGPAGAGGAPTGLDDNLNAPRDAHSTGNKDVMGDGTLGAAFDPCQLEGQFGLLTQLQQRSGDYNAVLSTAAASPTYYSGQRRNMVDDQLDWSRTLMDTASQWLQIANDFMANSTTMPVVHDNTDADVGTAGRIGFTAAAVGVPTLLGAGAGAAVGAPFGAAGGGGIVGGALGLAMGVRVGTLLNGMEGNRVAWGAGHPEWISNSRGRNEFRARMIPFVRQWFRASSSPPSFSAATEAAAPAASATGG